MFIKSCKNLELPKFSPSVPRHNPSPAAIAMDPSIMKLLEDDEDESMHSGADVDAFTAALNRDIGGDAVAISNPNDSDAGLLSQGSSSGSKQLLEQLQTSSQDGNAMQQIQQQDQQQHPMEQHPSSESGPPQQESDDKGKDQNVSSQTGNDEQLSNYDVTHSNKQAGQSETKPLPSVKGNQTGGLEQAPTQSTEQDKAQNSESQQQHTVQELNSPQASAANQANNPMRRMKMSSSNTIPFHMLIPVLRPHLDKDRHMQLMSMFAKLRNNEVSKDGFLRVIRNIVGDEMLRQAAVQVQVQAFRNSQTPNRYPLQAQAASQPHPTHGPLQTDASSSTLGISSQKSQETENQADGKGVRPVQTSATNASVDNQESEIPKSSTQAVNKQQQHTQPSQPFFSLYGSTGNSFHSFPYPRPPLTPATSSLKAQQDLQGRQSQVTQGTPSCEPMSSSSLSKHEKPIGGIETKTPPSGAQLTNPLQPNTVTWQPSTNKEQKNSAFPSIAHVKQEIEQNPDQHMPQFASPEGSSFGSVCTERGNSTPGSLKDENMEKQPSRIGLSTSNSMASGSQISGLMTAKGDPTMQMRNQMPSTTPLVIAGAANKTPPKKPLSGQKKGIEALSTASPLASNKKQKTSGAFLDQSIEQLNDVTAVSGVNLREEEEQLLSAPKEDSRASEATRRVVQEEEERLILQKGPLQKKLAAIASKCGILSTSSEVERCLSMCVEERLRGLIGTLIRLSKQRVDIEKTRHRFVITSDVRRQILAMNQKAKEAWEKKQAEQAEKLRKLNQVEGSTGPDAEKEKDEARSKTLKANKEEDDKMRTTAANVAARAAVGGDDMLSKWQLMAEQARQKREGLDGASGSQVGKTGTGKATSNSGNTSKEKQEAGKKGSSSSSISGGPRKMGKSSTTTVNPKIARSISIKDVIAVLEREPQMSKSPLIYRLYERIPSDPMTE